MKRHVIAGIGSRKTPKPILAEMEKIGRWCASKSVYVRSGHASGADEYFERGSGKYCIAYLPWDCFNKAPYFSDGVIRSSANFYVVSDKECYEEMTRKYHPSAEKLSRGARLLMNRNSCQILGASLHDPVSVIICWAEIKYDMDGNIVAGGTGQALRIAEAYNIPVINMNDVRFDTAEKVISKLEKIFNTEKK